MASIVNNASLTVCRDEKLFTKTDLRKILKWTVDIKKTEKI